NDCPGTPSAPNPRQKTAFAKTRTSARHFTARPLRAPVDHFASGRNFCKGHCSHRGCDFRQEGWPPPKHSPCIGLTPWTRAVRSVVLRREGRGDEPRGPDGYLFTAET